MPQPVGAGARDDWETPRRRIPAGEWLAIPAGGPRAFARFRESWRENRDELRFCVWIARVRARAAIRLRRVFLALGSLVSRSRGIQPREGSRRPSRRRVPPRSRRKRSRSAPGWPTSSATRRRDQTIRRYVFEGGRARRRGAHDRPGAAEMSVSDPRRRGRRVGIDGAPARGDPRIVGIRPRLARRAIRVTGSTPQWRVGLNAAKLTSFCGATRRSPQADPKCSSGNPRICASGRWKCDSSLTQIASGCSRANTARRRCSPASEMLARLGGLDLMAELQQYA